MKPDVIKSCQELLIQNSLQRIIQVLFTYPEKEFSLTDLAKESRVAKPNMNPILNKLEKLKLIKILKLSCIWRIKANQESLNFQKTKIIYNLNLIYNSGIIESLNDFYKNPKVIILFGSFRTGEDLSTSDIDIAIEVDEVKEYTTKSLNELKEFEKLIKRNIQIHLFHRKNIDINVFNSIANGIVLKGFLEVKP